MSTDNQWALSNPGSDTLLIWLEPWAEEFDVPSKSTITLLPADGCQLGDVEWSPDHLVIWASAPTVKIFIDGVFQDCGSAIIPIPDGLTKQMLNIAFAGQPTARLGGTHSGAFNRITLWKRIKRRFTSIARVSK